MSDIREQRAIRDESVVPLINVVFLLLIFFLLVGTLAPAADLEVELSRTTESPAADPPAHALYMAADGTLSHRGRLLETEDLVAAFVEPEDEADAVAPAPGGPLKVVLDRSLAARDIAPVLDALARAGVTRVEFVTAREREDSP